MENQNGIGYEYYFDEVGRVIHSNQIIEEDDKNDEPGPSRKLILDDETLIDLVRNYPILYDPSHPDHISKSKVSRTWIDITSNFEGISTNAIRKRWGNIKDAYFRSKKAHQAAERSGSGASTIKPYKYSEQLSFLNDSIIRRQTTSSQNLKRPRIAMEEESLPEPALSTSTSTSASKQDAVIKALNKISAPADEFDHFGALIAAELRKVDPADAKEKKWKILQIIYDKN